MSVPCTRIYGLYIMFWSLGSIVWSAGLLLLLLLQYSCHRYTANLWKFIPLTYSSLVEELYCSTYVLELAKVKQISVVFSFLRLWIRDLTLEQFFQVSPPFFSSFSSRSGANRPWSSRRSSNRSRKTSCFRENRFFSVDRSCTVATVFSGLPHAADSHTAATPSCSGCRKLLHDHGDQWSYLCTRTSSRSIE